MSEPVAALTQSEVAAIEVIHTDTDLDLAIENAPPMDMAVLKNILEAALLTSQEPLSLAELKKLGDVPLENSVVETILNQLAEEYSTRGIELNRVASGWRFRARPQMQMYIDRLNPQKPPRYSRAVMETLAIIAYRQPVTRGDIEEIRGVAVASQILKTLEARAWIEVIGTRDVPGKPELFATTQQLLDDLNLRSLHELPALEEMGSLLESQPAEAQPMQSQSAELMNAESETAITDEPQSAEEKSTIPQAPANQPD